MEQEETMQPVEETVAEQPKGTFIGPYSVSSITDNEETFTVKYVDETKDDEVYHMDYKELIVTDQPITMNEFVQRKANIITKPLLDLLRKYSYPINDMRVVIDVLNAIFKENEYRCYEKLFSSKPEGVTMNDFDRILS
jgi:hypothetical protein